MMKIYPLKQIVVLLVAKICRYTCVDIMGKLLPTHQYSTACQRRFSGSAAQANQGHNVHCVANSCILQPDFGHELEWEDGYQVRVFTWAYRRRFASREVELRVRILVQVLASDCTPILCESTPVVPHPQRGWLTKWPAVGSDHHVPRHSLFRQAGTTWQPTLFTSSHSTASLDERDQGSAVYDRAV